MAKTDLVPIKVKVFLGDDGKMAWPNFGLISASIRASQDWATFVDSHGTGWIYDKVENLGLGDDHDTACALVPKAFADEAVAHFPTLVSITDEAAFEEFHNNRSLVKQPDQFLDKEELVALNALVQLEAAGVAPAPSQAALDERAKMLDPTNQNARGIRKNVNKRYADARKTGGKLAKVTIHGTYAKP
jgi:hypothetical protein